MTILASSLGITRYRVVEDVPDELVRNIPALLKKNAFVDIDATAEERSFGWVNGDDMLDAAWTVSPPEKGPYFSFALRLDTRRVQPAVLKKHVTLALNTELAKVKEQGGKRISRDRKTEIKEQVMLRLRARSLPIPAVFPVTWNPSANRLYLYTTNAKVRALLEDCFQMTFELRLEPLAPFWFAQEILGEDAALTLENLEPTVFIQP